MAKDKKLWIDMCAGSELKDTQGETLSVDGADIDDLENGRGRFNDNHGKGFFNSLGRVTEAKKIFKSDDCENERHKYYWEKIKAPFIYAKGYLFNDEDHPNAKAAAAILRNIHREDAPLVMKASVEGGVIARGTADSTRLARTKIHSVALTFTPANNATLVEPINLDKSAIDWEADKQLIKSVMHLAETNVPSFRHIQRHASANSIHENIAKIKELSKHLGIEVNIELPEPEIIMKNAVFKKVESNILKINELVKAMKVNHLGLIGRSKGKLKTASPAKSAQAIPFSHPPVVAKWQGKGSIPTDHPDHQVMVSYINKLNATPHPDNLNANHSEAKRLYDAHIKDAKHSSFSREDVKKALLAGYGGAGSPTDMTGGGVIQPQSLDAKRKKKIKNKLIKISIEELHDRNPLLFRKEKVDKPFPRPRISPAQAVANQLMLESAYLYHGSKSHPFKKFGSVPEGKVVKDRVNALGPGHYFTSEIEDAARYGKYIGKITADLKNPAYSHKDVESSKINDYVQKIKKSLPDHADILSDYVKFKDNYKEYVPPGQDWEPCTAKAHQMDMSRFPDRDDVSYAKRDPLLEKLISNQDLLSEAYNKMLSDFGHDGIIFTGGGFTGAQDETLFFNNKDVGNIDWHKYDEEEKTITPLDSSNPDIYDEDYYYLNKSIEYITCDDCGHEQVMMPHQVRCRECKKNFSLYRLSNKK